MNGLLEGRRLGAAVVMLIAGALALAGSLAGAGVALRADGYPDGGAAGTREPGDAASAEGEAALPGNAHPNDATGAPEASGAQRPGSIFSVAASSYKDAGPYR